MYLPRFDVSWPSVDRKGRPRHVFATCPWDDADDPDPWRIAASGMAAWRRAGVVVLTLASTVLAAPAWGADDAVAARERGAAVIDAFVDHYRRTGDPASKLAELNAMAPALAAAVRTFVARGDNTGAAQTLIPLGDIHRMQARWEPALPPSAGGKPCPPGRRSLAHRQSAEDPGPDRKQPTRLRPGACTCRGGARAASPASGQEALRRCAAGARRHPGQARRLRRRRRQRQPGDDHGRRAPG